MVGLVVVFRNIVFLCRNSEIHLSLPPARDMSHHSQATFLCFEARYHCAVQTGLELLCSLGWSSIVFNNPPPLASHVLGLLIWATTTGFQFIFFCVFFFFLWFVFHYSRCIGIISLYVHTLEMFVFCNRVEGAAWSLGILPFPWQGAGGSYRRG